MSVEHGMNHFYSYQKLEQYFLWFDILLVTIYIVTDDLVILVCFLLLKYFVTFLGFILCILKIFPGNPLTQDILNLYLEPDGTRRLLNYLLDNLAGTAKRSKWSFVQTTFLGRCVRILLNFVFYIQLVSTEQPPPRSWIMLQEPDRTRPTGW